MLLLLVFLPLTVPVRSDGHDISFPQDPLSESIPQQNTAENFAQQVITGQGTLQQFLDLPLAEQKKFLEVADYNNPQVRIVLGSYFAQSAENVNSNKAAFVNFVNAKGIELVEFTGNIEQYNADGLLLGQEGSININDFKEGILKEKYSFSIINGVIHLVPKGTQKLIEIKGDLKKDRTTGNLQLDKGSIAGRIIVGGKNLRIEGEDRIEGEALQFAGVSFREKTPFAYDQKKNILKLANAKIKGVEKGTELSVVGSAIITDYGSVQGKLTVPPRQSLSVNNFKIKSGGNPVEVRFGGKNDLFSDLQGNFVRFSDTVHINGWVTVEVAEADVQKSTQYSDASAISIQEVPKFRGRSWFIVGDAPEEGVSAHGQIIQLKKALNAWHEQKFNQPYFLQEELQEGSYSEATAELVELFQQNHNKNNPSDKITEDGRWESGTLKAYQKYVKATTLSQRNIVVESRAGSTIVNYNPKKGDLTVDTYGNVDLILGNKRFSLSSEGILKEITRTTAGLLNSDVTVNSFTREGTIRESVTARSSDFSMTNLNGDLCLDCALHSRMNLEEARCAEFVRRDLAIRLVGTELADKPLIDVGGEKKTVGDALGYFGSGSWQLAHNVRGNTIFKSEEALLPEEQRLLFEVERAVRTKFKNLKARNVPDEIIRQKLRDEDVSLSLPPDLRERYRGKNLQQIHDQILGKNPRFEITQLANNDYIGLYHLGSKYLGTASLNGKNPSNEIRQDLPPEILQGPLSDLEHTETGYLVAPALTDKPQDQQKYTVQDSLQNNRHTHSANGYWGSSAIHQYEFAKDPRLSVEKFLKRTYGLRNDQSLQYLGRIYVEDPRIGNLREAKVAANGRIYFVEDIGSSGTPLPGKNRIVLKQDTVIEVQPYMVRHLDGKIHDEPLARAVDTKNSLYLVKRPDANLLKKIQQQAGISPEDLTIQVRGEAITIEETLREMNVPEENLPEVAEHVRRVNQMNSYEAHEGDVIKLPKPEVLRSASISISGILRQNGLKNPERWAEAIRQSTEERLREYPTVEPHRLDFEKLTAGIINRESKFGLSDRYEFKSNVEKILPEFLNPFGSKGYAQIDLETAREIAERHGEQLKTEELSTREGSVKFAQRRLAEAFELYAPQNRPLSEGEKVIIASTYNAGLLRPRNAALQQQLKDLNYFPPEVDTSGSLGPATLKAFSDFAKAEGISVTQTELKEMLGKSSRGEFEQGLLYTRLKGRWEETFKQKPLYAQLPQLETEKAYTGKITSKGYSQAVVNYVRGKS